MVRLGRARALRAGAAAFAVVACVVTLALVSPLQATATSNQGDTSSAWPSVWNPYRHTNGTTINDVNGDINPTDADIASGACSGCAGASPSVYYYADGTTAFFRLRLATDPGATNKGGIFGTAYLVQIAVNGTVQAVVGVDGKDNSADYVYVTNAVGSSVIPIYTYPWTGGSAGVRLTNTGDGTGQFFLDFQVPISHLTTVSGGAITSNTAIQMFFGSSQAANLAVINKDYMEGSAVSFANLATVSMQPASVTLSSSAAAQTGPTPPAVGVPTTYRVTVTASNPGGSILTSTAVSIPLGSGVTLNSSTPEVGTISGSGTLTWTIGSLNPGQTVSAVLDITVTPGAGDVGNSITLVSAQSVSGTDAPASATRTANATALTTGAVTAAPATYTVTFDSQGGTSVSSANVTDGNKVTQPTAPTKAHATFAGWSTSSSGPADWDFSTDVVTGNLTLYALWTVDTHTVTFNSGGGSAVTGQTVDYGSPASEPTDPTRAGYTFGGWATTPGGSTLWSFSDPITGNTTLYAVWTPVNYTVTFDSQGGSVVGSQGVDYGDHATAPSDPTRTHYTFDGWATTPGGGTMWNFSTDTVAGAMTLYAQWSPAVYTVTFHSGSGSPVSDANVAYGGTVTQPTPPTRAGYVFGGWATTDGGSTLWNFSTDTVGGPTELWAIWTPIVYDITFDAQGGSSVASDTGLYGDLVTEPTPPTRTGFDFSGWATEPDGDPVWDFANDLLTSDVTLYAVWTPHVSTVVFDSQGGSAVGDQNVPWGDLVTEPGAPTRPGFAFAGWATEADGTPLWDFHTDTMAADMTLYAVWVPADATVTYDSQGGTSVDPAGASIGSIIGAPGNPSRTGYRLLGWSTTPGGSLWDFDNDLVGGDTTLYAVWEILHLTVTFNSQGGSAVAPQTVDYGNQATTPTAPTRSSYTFDGWFTAPTGGSAWDATAAVTLDATVYARWSPALRVVTFRSGNQVNEVLTVDGGTVTPPAPPARQGYRFLGWYTAPTGGTLVDPATITVTSNFVVYAHWEDESLAATGADAGVTGRVALAALLAGLGAVVLSRRLGSAG